MKGVNKQMINHPIGRMIIMDKEARLEEIKADLVEGALNGDDVNDNEYQERIFRKRGYNPDDNDIRDIERSVNRRLRHYG